MLDIVPDRKVDAEGRGLWALLGWVDVALVPGCLVPRTGKVVGHHVPEVEVLVHLPQLEPVAVGGSRWGGDGEEEVRTALQGLAICL